ncbi:MAG: hypothetical protein DMF67_18085 [Acidobacteria bacterium]|nr:MAG: hypothetical protein DMF67_18085 [Acidobacteriota bacterium]
MKTSHALAALLFITLACASNSATGARAQTTVVVQTEAPPPQPAQTTIPQSAATADAQADNATKKKRAADSITGRVLSEGGEPLGGVSVSAIPRSSAPNFRTPHMAVTDDEGGFRVVGLEPGIYSVNANVPGYVAEVDPLTGRAGGAYKPGDAATVRLVKGGVITGTATDAQGEPLVALSMRAYRVRDLDGRTPPPNATYVGAGRTDDRGVYRIYGLQPGAYVVVAGGQSSPSFGVVSPYDADAPTFYPSSTRDTAAEVTVRAGAEAAGVDIRYREEQGHRVTGKIEPSAVTAEPNYSIVLGLSYASSSIQAGMYYVNPSTSNLSFSFEGVADGDYDLNATLAGRDGLVGTAAPQRVTVRGTDVTGLRVALAPLASVSGTLVVEQATEIERARPDCKGTHAQLPPQETLVAATFDRPASARALPAPRTSLTREATPDDAGAFTLRSLEAGRYRLAVRPFDENLYVRSIQLPGANVPAAAQHANAATPAASRANAAATTAPEALDIRPGQQLSGVTVRLSEGAASLSGHVVAAEGAQTPPYASLRVHLLPAEREHADDALRLFETTPGADGAFSFKNLPPGRYLLLARVTSDATDAAPRPASWDTDSRTRLRREAEAANTTVELQPCQRATDFTLRFPPPAPK